MKQYLSLLLVSLFSYGADQIIADVSCSEITCDYSEFGKAELTPRAHANVNNENNDETPLLPYKPKRIIKRLRRAHSTYNSLGMLVGEDLTPHAHSIITLTGGSRKSYRHLEALAQQAREEKWPAVEQTVIAMFMDKHHYSPAKEQKRLQRKFWRKVK
jgi:hypothetical protein